METRVYSPEPPLRRPKQFFREMFSDLRSSWELSVALAKRDLSALYRQSILGYLWAFLPVVGTTAVFLFLRSGQAFDTGEPGMSFPLYLLVGTVLWQVFVDAVNGPLKVITSSRAMLVKINFPREALILAAMLITGFNFLVRLAILIPALVFFYSKGLYDFHVTSLILFPIGVLGIVILGYCIGVLLTPLGVLYKDVSMAVQMVMMFWMFLSPVVIVAPESGSVATLMSLNPVTPLLNTTRGWLIGVESTSISGFLVVVTVALCLLFVGWVIFRVSLPHIISRLGM